MVGSWASEVDGASFVLGSPRGLLRKNIIGDDLVKTWAVPHERRQWRLAGRIKLPSILLIALVLALQCVSGVRALSLGSLAARRATPRTHASSPLPPVDAALFPMPGTQLVRREEPRALLTHFEYWPRSWPRWAVRLALLLRLPLKPVAKVGLRSYRVEARGGSVMGDAVGVEEGQPPAALGLLVYMHVLPRSVPITLPLLTGDTLCLSLSRTHTHAAKLSPHSFHLLASLAGSGERATATCCWPWPCTRPGAAETRTCSYRTTTRAAGRW